MRKGMWLLSLLAVLVSPLSFAREKAILLKISGPIGPATQDYVQRGLTTAAQEHAGVVIIQINTTGGLDNSMRGINQAIITSSVPVITYVAPKGAHATSAGTAVLYASHLAAMAPGTNVGVATPITLLGSKINVDANDLSASEMKILNDASLYLRNLAQLRGRNAEWAVQAVKHSVSISAEEALRLKVIDEIAENLPDLMQKIDGRTAIVLGTAMNVKTKNLYIKKIALDWRHAFLSYISNPNIAYVLILLAIGGLFFELSNPGLVLPGLAGVMLLLLALYAFRLLPINYTGLSLLLLGIGLMILQVYFTAYGMPGMGGVIAFDWGSVILFDLHDPNYHLLLWLVVLMSGLFVAFFFMVHRLATQTEKYESGCP